MTNMTRRIGLAVAVLGLIVGTAGRARAALVFGGVSSSLAPGSGPWSWDGPELTSFRAALQNPAYFGPGGTDPTSITTTTLGSVTASTLAGINVFVSPYLYNGDSSAFANTVVSWFLNGGSLFLLQDSSLYDQIGALLGVPTAGASTGSVSNGTGALFNGPFGTPTNVTQTGTTGYLSASDVSLHGGTIGATNQQGQVTAAYWQASAYAPGSGALVIYADVDMISNPYGSATYGPLDSNGIFALNGAAFLASQAAPEPSTLISGGMAGLIGLGYAWRRRKAKVAA